MDKIDKAIQSKFSSSFMNNTKWEKLIDALTDDLDEIHIDYKLIHSEQKFATVIDSAEQGPFFIEPIFYKEVEWIKFPSEYLCNVSKNNLKASKRTYSQDLSRVSKIINRLGRYNIEVSESDVTLYAYR